MNLQLYYAPGACSFVPHAMLEASGLAWEPKPIKLHKAEQYGDEFKAINPRSQVPVLVVDGQAITQIVAIVDTIDQLCPTAGFIPKAPLARAKWMETIMWLNNTVHPTFTHVFMPLKFADDAAAQEVVKAFNLKNYRKLLGELQTLLDAAKAAGHAGLGGAIGPLDWYALTVTRWGSIVGINPADYPSLWAHVQTVAQDPATARAVGREKLTLNMFKGN